MKKGFLFIVAVTFLIAALIYFVFTIGSEWISSAVADIIPIEIQKKIGQTSLSSMETQELEASNLPQYTQNKISKRFFHLIQQDSSEVKLYFKRASYPNAFALPGNYIVILDSLVKMSKDTANYTDVLGVLAHEYGHLHYKHSLKLVIKGGLIGVIISYFVGDFSLVVAGMAKQMLSLSYSRNYEEQADDYAISLMRKNNLSLLPLATMLESIDKMNVSGNVPAFLSTHPGTEDRVKKLRGTSNL